MIRFFPTAIRQAGFGCLPALIIWFGLAAAAHAEAPTPESARYFPESTLVYAELPDPTALISLVLDHPLREEIESLPVYEMATQSPRYKRFLFGRALLEGQLEMPGRQILETVFAGSVVAGFDPQTGGLAVVLNGKDAESIETMAAKLVEMARMAPDGGNLQQAAYRGIEAYRIDDLRIALYENRVLLTNNSDMGKAILDRMIDGGASLADRERFQTAKQQQTPDAAAWLFVDIQGIRDRNIADDLYYSQINNPVAELLFGGIQSVLTETPYATASLQVDPQRLQLQASTPFDANWIPEHRDYYFGPEADGKAAVLPEVDQTLARLTTYRNFSEMWLRAGDLFNEQVNDDLAQADANLGTLFAGRDFGEEILGSFQPEVGIVAVRQDFSTTLPRPAIKLPAFAAVFQLRNPETMTGQLRRNFQSLVGFLNIVGAMNGQNQMELGMEKLGDGAELVTSEFVPEQGQQQATDAKIIFNFSPSVGFAGERFVVASSSDLAQLTVAEISQDEKSLYNTQASLNASVLRDTLGDNRDQLVAQNMLEEGHTLEEAQANIDLLLKAVSYFESVTLTLGQQDGQLVTRFRLEVKP